MKSQPDTRCSLHAAACLAALLAITCPPRQSAAGADAMAADTATAQTSRSLCAANLVVDPGFEPGTILHAFARAPGNPWIPGEWNAESANIITGSIGAVSPFAGNGMIRINSIGGTHSQVNQIINVTAYGPTIDSSGLTAGFSIQVNAMESGVSALLLILAGASQNPSVGVLNPVGGAVLEGFNRRLVSVPLDADPATWQLLSGSLDLPVGTRFLELQFLALNTEISPNGLFFDDASTELATTAAAQKDYQIDLIPPLPIPDNNPAGVTSTFDVPDSGLIDDVDIDVSITHTWVGELQIEIAHGGTTVLLSNLRGGNGDDFSGTIFDDEAGTHVGSGTAPFDGRYRPEQPLSAFDGMDKAGPWSITVYDTAEADTGTLDAWSLHFVNSAPTFPDCNGSLVPDECDVLNGSSADLNGNLVPDECEVLVKYGLPHLALGQAVLTVDPGSGDLAVSNIGSSGNDGVLVRVPGSEGLVIDLFFDSLADGSSIRFEERGEVAGAPDQTLLTMTLLCDNGICEYLPDFSSVGAATYTLELWNDGLLVAELPGLSGPVLSHAMVAEARPGKKRCVFKRCGVDKCPKWSTWWYRLLHQALLVDVAGYGQFAVDNAVFVAEGTCDIGAHSYVTVQAAAVPDFAIQAERLKQFLGEEHEALGTATLDASGGALSISNLGSTGQDGVSVHWEDDPDGRCPTCPKAFQANWLELDPGGTMPVGAYLQASAVGKVDGVAAQPLGNSRLRRKSMLEYEVTADFSDLGSPTQLVQVYNGGMLVAEFQGHSGPVASVALAPSSGGRKPIRRHLPPPSGYWWGWDGELEITVGGGPTLIGDELCILAEAPVSVEYLEEFSLTAASLSSFTIAAEATLDIACPYACGDIDGSGGPVDLVDFTIFSTCFGQMSIVSDDCSCADLNADGLVDLTDFANFAALFGTTSSTTLPDCQ